MTKKYNSEQTIERIVAVSRSLFLEKGYEKTSMQDIVNALGMSKGAIFHHFPSKEAILSEVARRQIGNGESIFERWLEEKHNLTAKEKLMSLMGQNIADEFARTFNILTATKVLSPHVVISITQNNMAILAPLIAKLMREGVEDGSITTDSPDECAEVFILLLNMWCDPVIFECDMPTLHKRMKYLQQVMKKLGADIVSDEWISEGIKFIERFTTDVAEFHKE